MKKLLTLLATTTALSAAIGAPAWSAMHMAGDTAGLPYAAAPGFGHETMPPIFVSDDDDDDHEYRNGSRYDDDCDDDDDSNGGDDDCGGNAGNAAPAGTVAPPQNGLFGNGAAPIVQVN